MAPVAESPFLELQIEWLASHGVRDVVLCVGYRHEQIRDHFGDGDRLDVRIRYSVEEHPLGTAGALKLAMPLAGGPFLALNGDTFVDLDLSSLVAFHCSRRASDTRCCGTLALTSVPDGRDFGCVALGPDGRIAQFDEKPEQTRGESWISAGVYVLEPSLLELVPDGARASLEQETFPAALARGDSLYGRGADGFFVDIGTPPGYRRLQQYMEAQRNQS